jgi:hypothetical protein
VSSLSVSRAHETLAALLARSLSEAALLLRHREGYVEGAAVGGSAPPTLSPRVEYDIYLSYPTAHELLARELAEALHLRGVNVFFDQWALLPGDQREYVLAKALRRSRMFVVMFDRGYAFDLDEDIATMLELAEKGRARFVPIGLSSVYDLPRKVRQFQGIVPPRLTAVGPVMRGSIMEDLMIDIPALAEMLVPLALQR